MKRALTFAVVLTIAAIAGEAWAQYNPRVGVVRVSSAGPALSGCGMMGNRTRIRVSATSGMFDPQNSRDRTPEVQLSGSGPIEFSTDGSSWVDSPAVVPLPNRDNFVFARQKAGSGGTTNVLFSISGCPSCDGSPGAAIKVQTMWDIYAPNAKDPNPYWTTDLPTDVTAQRIGGIVRYTDTRPYKLGPQTRFTLAADRGGLMGGC